MIRNFLIIGSLLVAQAAFSADETLNVEVRRLVRQLDAPQLGRREAAEAELLRLGPPILDLLPPTTERASAEVRQRLGRVRQKLQQIAADAAAKASLITLQAKDMRLSEILAALQSQSGNTIVDYRREFGQPTSDPTLNLSFDGTPFWSALDQLLEQAGLAVYPYGRKRAISIVASSGNKSVAGPGLVSYSGPFRFEATTLIARRDMRHPDGGSLVVTLDAAWEPRLRIIKLVNRMADVNAVDEQGNLLPVAQSSASPEAVASSEASAVTLELPFRLPPRNVRQIASLQGKLSVTVPGRIETFRFDKLEDAKNVERRIAGVTVTLAHVRRSGDVVEVAVRTRFDEAGDALASHRQWIFDNEAYLEGPDGKSITHESFETTAQAENELGVTYRFATDRPLAELVFVYKSPGSIVTSDFDYELKNLELP